MERRYGLVFVLLVAGGQVAAGETTPVGRDLRDIRTGYVIPDEGYCDQPYTVVTKDGSWLCTLTTGPGKEGNRGQHVVATISSDRGRTWSELIDIEPSSGPEASWVMPLVTPSGRVYAFYVYNAADVRTWQGRRIRADTLGWYVYKYSDDGGRTWSRRRYRLPLPLAPVDRGNDFGGRFQLFWGIGKPIVASNSVYFAFSRCGKHLIERSEGWFYRSDNILSEPDPQEIEWHLLPDGERGLRNPTLGEVQAEQNLVALADGSLYCMYRTTTGYPSHAYSRDGGHTWTRPEHATYMPGGSKQRKMKTPRACPRIWRTDGGKFLFWFHNHSGKDYRGRNPAWISGGVEKDGHICWSQPEILLYDPDPDMRISYPDLIEQDGEYWITETQKEIARVHRVDRTLLEGLWRQGEAKGTAERGLTASFRATDKAVSQVTLPRLPNLTSGGGITVDFVITVDRLAAGQVILDSRDDRGKGLALTATDDGAVRIQLHDGSESAAWESDRGHIQAGKRHHVAVIVDGGPKIITFVVNGQLNDGGEARQYGWGRFSGRLDDVNGSPSARILPLTLSGPGLRELRIYDRSLWTSEAVGNYRAAGGS